MFWGSCVFRVKSVHNTWVPPSQKFVLAWRKEELEETGSGGKEASEEAQGRKLLPAPLLLGQQKKQTTVNAATRQLAHGAGAFTRGPGQGTGQRFPEREEGLEEPVRDQARLPHNTLLPSLGSTRPAAGTG